MSNLIEYRNAIDDIDKQITELFEQRMNIAVQIADLKKKNGLTIFNGNREKEVINQNISLLKNKEYAAELEQLFTVLMLISKNVQSRRIKSSSRIA